MTMREGETLKTYFDRYWEMFNEIDGNFDDIAIRTFKVSLPAKHDLRKSLTRKPARSVRQLMDYIDEYNTHKEDQLQRKWKTKVIPQDRNDFRSDIYNNNQPRRDFAGNPGLLLLRWSTQCSVNQCIKSWKKLRMSYTLNGQIR